MKSITLFALGIFVGAVLAVYGMGFIYSKKPSDTNISLQPTPTSPPSVSPTQVPDSPYSKKNVAKHSFPEDCWIIVRSKIYDVTSYLVSDHPGGAETITPFCGKESTVAFETKETGSSHTKGAWSMLDAYYIGDLAQ